MTDLAWLQGTWRNTSAKSQGEERWVITAANTLAGSAWVVEKGAVNFVEALSIASAKDTKDAKDAMVELHLRHFNGALTHAWEDRDAPMIFALSHCEDNAVIFDGTGAKGGEHITYRRAGDKLSFIGDFLHDGKPVKVEIEFQKSG